MAQLRALGRRLRWRGRSRTCTLRGNSPPLCLLSYSPSRRGDIPLLAGYSRAAPPCYSQSKVGPSQSQSLHFDTGTSIVSHLQTKSSEGAAPRGVTPAAARLRELERVATLERDAGQSSEQAGVILDPRELPRVHPARDGPCRPALAG